MKFGVALVSGYLLGSISFAYLIVYALTGEDVRKLGDGNPGAANVARTLGRKWGVLVWSGDVTKTLVALTFARRLGVEHPVFLTLVGIAAILGHCYSIFLKFRGGKGVACMGAVILFIMPRLFPLAIFLWFLIQKLN
ncbi:MAG TPA: glycerol-3-phosphate acyltransferase, partial [bacterium]|nr:glycerol-3-phosphate acyltransferase [bacterium]